jgi:type I restriction enzyme S subunit
MHQLLQHLDTLANTSDAPAKLRNFVLSLAVRGQLLPQNAEEEKHSPWKEFAAKFAHPDTQEQDASPFFTPKSWRWVRLDDVADYAAADKVDPSQIKDGDWVLDLEEIEKDTSRIVRIARFAEKQSSSTKAKFLPGDVLYGKLRPYLNKVVVAPQVGFCTTEIVPIRSRGIIEPRYLCLYLRSPDFVGYANLKSYGMKMPRLGTDDAKSAWVAVPPPPEQRRIVAKVEELLTLCDELEARQTAAREHRTRLVRSSLDHLTSAQGEADFKKHSAFCLQHSELLFDSVPALRQAILSLAVDGKLCSQLHGDQTAGTFLAEVAQSSANETRMRGQHKGDDNPRFVSHLPATLPPSWTSAPLEKLFRFIDYRGRTPQKSSTGIRLITAKNVRRGFVSESPIEYLEPAYYSKWMTRGFPRRGDLLFVTEGHTMGFVGMIEFEFAFALGQRTINLQPYLAGYSKFFHLVLMSRQFQSAIQINATGSAAKGIKAAKLKRIRVVVPPLAEQQRIVAKVDELMRWCDALEARLADAQTTATHLFDATLHQILSGSDASPA